MKGILFVLLMMCGGVLLFTQNPWVCRDHPKWDRSWNQRPFPHTPFASLEMPDSFAWPGSPTVYQ
jgi:hypothetical protein